MILKESNGIKWLEFELFAGLSGLRHAVFLRDGGHSLGDYNSLNLSEYVGDCLEAVKKNKKKAAASLSVSALFSLKQCHGKNICIVDDLISFLDMQGDALMTNIPERALMINHADCQAAIFYDPIHHAMANVHAGWRGSVQNIYGETINKMQKMYGTHPKDLLVGISPSLGPEDAQFINYRTELPELFWRFQVRPLYFDFWEISRWQLIQSGVLPQHIEIAGISTYSSEDFFSYRRTKVSGRNGTVAVLS